MRNLKAFRAHQVKNTLKTTPIRKNPSEQLPTFQTGFRSQKR